jgi:anti-sigma factor RsiW
MNAELKCEQTLLVQADFDGELDAAESIAVHQHRRDCAACTSAYETLSRTHGISQRAAHHVAPLTLRAAVMKRARPQRRMAAAPWFGGAFAGLAAAALAVVLIRTPGSETQALLDSHVRALQSSSHLIDVESSEHHVVKPWFNGHLDYSPPVKDLAAQGYPLHGGRIDVFEGQSVAVLVYQAGRHSVDLFVRPTNKSAGSVHASTDRGFNIRDWTADGMRLTAVSDLNAHELDAFVSEWQSSQ